MSQKISIEQTQEIFSKFGLTVLENEAKGVNHKYKCIDKNGYLYSRSTQSAQTCLRNKTKNGMGHIFSTKNPFFYENMLHFIELNAKEGTTLLTDKKEIKSVDQPLKFRCGICGKEYSTSWHQFSKLKYKVCNFCFNRMWSKGEVDNKHKDTNKFHEQAFKNGLTILGGPDINYHDKITVQDKNGYRGLVHSSSILRGSSFDRFGKSNPYTIDNMRVYALHKGWDCVVYNQEYKSDKIPLRLMCSCGNDFEVDINHFVAGKYKCNECRVKQSAISASVELFLSKHQINYTKEKTFKNCVNKNQLPFDFYLPDYYACIEVDGIGHYRPIPFGGDKENAKLIFQERQTNDKIKDDFCSRNDIALLRLPFWIIENNEHEKMIQDFILSIKSNELDK